MIVRTYTGESVEVNDTGRFIMIGTGDYVTAYIHRDAIRIARAILVEAAIVPTPQASGYESFSLPPDDTAIGLVNRG